MKFKKFGKALLMSALSVGGILGVTSCVQSYTVGFLYVTGTVTSQTSGNGIITGFKIDHNTGKLALIHGLPISSGGANPGRAVLLLGGRFIYVLNRGENAEHGSDCTTADPCLNSNITIFAVGGNGILTAQPEVFYTQGINPFRILADSTGTYLYVLDHDSPAPGSTPSNPIASSPANPNPNCALALGGGAKACGDITAFQINQTTGRLELVVNAQVTSQNCPNNELTCPLPYFPVPSNPIDFLMSNGYALTLTGTPATGDSVFPYNYVPQSGQLTISQNSPQPLNIHQATAIIAATSYVYVLDNEPIKVSGVTSPSQILPFTVGNGGALQAQTGGSVADDPTLSNPNYLIAESKGRWVYVANQGNNTDQNNAQSGIAAYDVTQGSNQLTPMAGEPFGIGAGPQCLLEDPSNQFIYSANFNDSTVTGRSIDQNNGNLRTLNTSTSSYPLTGPPAWCLVTGRTS